LEKDELNDMEPEEHWRNAVLMVWHMYKQKPGLEDFAESLPGELDHFRGLVNSIATQQILIECQMLMPQNRWVQVTIANAKLSALMANCLWSHTDPAALTKMNKIISDDGLPEPQLTLTAKCGPRESAGDTVTAGQHVLVTAELHRGHAASADQVAQPACNNPQGIYEAYWLYIEGIKPAGTPNSLIVAKPMVVTDLKSTSVSGEAVFQAPGVPGEYNLRVHVLSTSVIGVCLTTDTKFIVEEDDVPNLE